MSISLLLFLSRIEIASEIRIAHACWIHWNIFAVEHANSYFVKSWWFQSDIPFLDKFFSIGWNNFHPHFDNTLTNWAGWMVNLSIFNWLFVKINPFKIEVSIFNIQHRLTDHFITKDSVIIIDSNANWRSTRELTFEVVFLIELRVWTINLIFISLPHFLTVASNMKIRIRCRPIISRRQIKCLNHVYSHDFFCRWLQHLFKNDIWFEIDQVFGDIQMVYPKFSHGELKFISLSQVNKLGAVDMERLFQLLHGQIVNVFL